MPSASGAGRHGGMGAWWSGGRVVGWTLSPNPKGLNMNRPDTIHESGEPEGFEYELMIAGIMIFDPVRGRMFSGGIRVLFKFDAFSIRETGRREDFRTVRL